VVGSGGGQSRCGGIAWAWPVRCKDGCAAVVAEVADGLLAVTPDVAVGVVVDGVVDVAAERLEALA
jgi:hypothetical protein